MTRRKAAPVAADILPWKVEEVTLDRLHQHPDNVNEGDVDAIADSILTLGYAPTIVARPHPDNTDPGDDALEVLGGWGTTRACRLLKLGQVPVTIVRPASDAAARKLLVALNRLPQLATVEPDALARLLGKVAADDGGLAGTGYHEPDLARLLGRDPSPPADGDGSDDTIDVRGSRAHKRRRKADPDDTPPAPEAAPVTQPGDLWTLGPHRVLCADSVADDGAAVLEQLGTQRAALFLTDPPYAIYGNSTGVDETIADDRMVRPFFEGIARLARAATSPFAHVYICCDWRSWSAWWDATRAAKLRPSNMLVWDKAGAGLGSMYAMTHELVGFWTNQPTSGRTMSSGRATGHRQVHRPNVLRHPRVSGSDREHNAAKPVAMLRELIENSTDPGGLVLDPFAGSGSTLIACDVAGRACLTVDVEPRWCDVTVARWARLNPGQVMLRNGEPHHLEATDG